MEVLRKTNWRNKTKFIYIIKNILILIFIIFIIYKLNFMRS